MLMRMITLLVLLMLPSYGALAAEEKPLCKVSGCSNQLCVSSDSADTVGTCEFKAEYACYKKHGKCMLQQDGQCGWSPDQKLDACIGNAANASLPFSRAIAPKK